jgi:hypothetical protein
VKNFAYLVTLILLLTSTISHAYVPEEGRISIYGGPMWYKSYFTNTSNGAKSIEQGSTGLVVIGDINTLSSLEVGLFFLNKQYQRDLQGRILIEQTKLAHITMGYRRWLNEIFSLSFTLSSGYSMGDPEIIYTDFLPADNIDTSARDTTEYGLDISLQTELWKKEDLSVVLDTRFAKLFTAKDDEKADHFAVMLALQYKLQEKNQSANLDK